jgi:hypothetical protein
MRNTGRLRVCVGFLLCAVDAVVAMGLLLGGWNVTSSHALTGYACLLLALGLLYLSSGVWTKQRWKLVGRVAIYAVAFSGLAVSTVVLLVVRAFPSTTNSIVIYPLIGSLFLVVLLSMFHLILVKQEGHESPDQVLP